MPLYNTTNSNLQNKEHGFFFLRGKGRKEYHTITRIQRRIVVQRCYILGPKRSLVLGHIQ